MATETICRMQGRPVTGMAGGAIAAPFEAFLHRSAIRVTMSAIVIMRYDNRSILARPRIVAVPTRGRSSGYYSSCHMVDIAVRG